MDNMPEMSKCLKELTKKVKDWNKKPCTYPFNLLDELHANENAHTRILVRLLQVPALLRSFLMYLKENFAEQAQFDIPDQLYPSDVSEFSDYIDAKIETKNFCIIIENKINNAVDQDRQIERYVDKMKPHNNNIFVLYLTLEGNKEASSDSIGKIKVPIIPVNYNDHILNWLENKITFSISDTLQQPFLQSGILQYIDHLKGRLGKRERECDKHLGKIKEFIQKSGSDIFDIWAEVQYFKAFWRIYFTRNIPKGDSWNIFPGELKTEILFELCGQIFKVNRTTDNRNCFLFEGDIFSLEAVTASKISLMQIDIHYSGNSQGVDKYKEFVEKIRAELPPYIEFEYNDAPCLRVAIDTAAELQKLFEILDLKSDFQFNFAEFGKEVDQINDYFRWGELEKYLIAISEQSDHNYEEKNICFERGQISKSYFYNKGCAIQLTQKFWKQPCAIDIWSKDDGTFAIELVKVLNKKEKIYPYSCRWWNGKFYLHFPLLSLEDNYTEELSQMLYDIYLNGLKDE